MENNYPEYPAPAAPARRLNLKRLLALILGGLLLAVLTYIVIDRVQWSVAGAAVSMMTAVLYAGMIFCVLNKKIPAIILSAAYLALTPALMAVTSLSGVIRYDWISYTPYFLLAVLQLVYACCCPRGRNSIVWMLVAVGILVYEHVCQVIDFPAAYGDVMFDIDSLLVIGFYVIGFSPDKWWRKG